MNRLISSHIQYTDSMIIEGMLAGDQQAFEQLYETCFPRIMGMIVRNSGTEDEAKDVFQEAVCVLYDKILAGDFTLSSQLHTYLYSVCKRLWLKQLKFSERWVSDEGLPENEAAIEEDLELHWMKEAQFDRMKVALARLGEPCKSILIDFYVNGMSMQEICEKFNYTNPDNAKNQKYKCLQRLKKLFFEVGNNK